MWEVKAGTQAASYITSKNKENKHMHVYLCSMFFLYLHRIPRIPSPENSVTHAGRVFSCPSVQSWQFPPDMPTGPPDLIIPSLRLSSLVRQNYDTLSKN